MTKVTNTRVGVHDMAKKPNIEDFRKIVRKSGGNLTKVASTFKVARKTIYQWAKEDSDFKDAISDERGSLVDECLVSARVLALGIPEKDENGNFVGWIYDSLFAFYIRKKRRFWGKCRCNNQR